MIVDIDKAVSCLSQGQIVAYPTETLYGLGVDATNADAIGRLFVLKGRNENQPFPILLPRVEDLSKYVLNFPHPLKELINRYWPGPLTVVLKAHNLPSSLMDPDGRVGFRVSAHPIAQHLIQDFGRPITSTSANLSGHTPWSNTQEIAKALDQKDVVIVDGGEIVKMQPSTVVGFSKEGFPALLRPGLIPWTEIESFLKEFSHYGPNQTLSCPEIPSGK